MDIAGLTPWTIDKLNRAAILIANGSCEIRCRHIPNRGRGCGIIMNAPFLPRED